MDLILVFFICILLLLIGMVFFLFIKIKAIEELSNGVVDILTRTLEYYYDTKEMQPCMVNNGIDIVYNPEKTEDVSNKKGFITIWFEGAGCDTPIKDVKEADVLSEKIIKVVEKHLKERDLGV